MDGGGIKSLRNVSSDIGFLKKCRDGADAKKVQMEIQITIIGSNYHNEVKGTSKFVCNWRISLSQIQK